MSEYETIDLVSVAGGAAVERFSDHLQEVLKNIADPNTDPKAKRKITLEFTIAPTQDRESGEIELKTSVKLAGPVGVAAQAFFGRKGGQLVAIGSNPKQPGLFDEESPKGPAMVRKLPTANGSDEKN